MSFDTSLYLRESVGFKFHSSFEAGFTDGARIKAEYDPVRWSDDELRVMEIVFWGPVIASRYVREWYHDDVRDAMADMAPQTWFSNEHVYKLMAHCEEKRRHDFYCLDHAAIAKITN